MVGLLVQRADHEKVLTVQPGHQTQAGGGVGIQLMQQQQQHQPPPPPRQQAARPMAPPPPPPPPPPVNEEELLDTMNEFANPIKKTEAPHDGYIHDDFDFGSDGGSIPMSDGGSGGMDDDMDDDDMDGGVGMGGGAFGAQYAGAPQQQPQEPPPEQPSKEYRTIDEEKAAILSKLHRLQRQGVKGIRQFTPYSDVRDMRTEMYRVETELNLERSVKFQRKILMAIVSALEWGNTRFNPFDLELEGWSEHMHQNVQENTEYDGVFEELYFKYRGKVSTPPEVRLLLMVGGSAMMFHMSKALIKSAGPNMLNLISQNPAMMESVMKGFGGGGGGGAGGGVGGGFGGGGGGGGGGNGGNDDGGGGGRREMKGPGLDIGGLTGGLFGGGGGGGNLGNLFGGGGGGGSSSIPGMPGINSSALGHLPSSMPMPNPSLLPTNTRGDRRAAPQPQRYEQPFDDDGAVDTESDRLSDVLSDDLRSLPDDLDPHDDSASDRSGGGAKRITIPSAKPPSKKRKTGPKSTAKVITL